MNKPQTAREARPEAPTLETFFNLQALRDAGFSLSQSGTCHAYVYGERGTWEIFLDSSPQKAKIGFKSGFPSVFERKAIQACQIAVICPPSPMFQLEQADIQAEQAREAAREALYGAMLKCARLHALDTFHMLATDYARQVEQSVGQERAEADHP